MVLILLTLTVFAVCALGVPDIKPIEDVVKEFNYPIETHKVTTSDDYILTVHRLPGGKKNQDRTTSSVKGVPVLVVEGILQSSASNLAKGNGIAYSLADQGFDVWLSNYRGNMFSREHVHLKPTEKSFWDFTLHEFGTKDLPALIDYILERTHKDKLFYLGFSMGSTMFWIMASTLPDYQNKVEAMIAIGPVARPSNTVVLKNKPLLKSLDWMYNWLWNRNKFEIMPYGQTMSNNIKWACTDTWFSFSCRRFINNMNHIRKTGMEIESTFKLIPYSPAGISTKVVIHYLQIAGKQRFQQFDYGKANKDKYGTETPPEYDLKKVTLPVYFVYSDTDMVATTKDIDWLMKQLPRRPPRIIETVKHFRHVDFSVNMDLDKLLTKPLTAFIKQLAEKASTTDGGSNRVKQAQSSALS